MSVRGNAPNQSFQLGRAWRRVAAYSASHAAVG